MVILITGIDGFTGTYVQAELEANGYDAIGLSSDLTDKEAVSDELSSLQPDAVVHLAGIASVDHGDAAAFYNVNLIGTRNLLESLARYVPRVQSVLLASSANIYGNQSKSRISEDFSPDPVNDYAVSKLAMEYMARLWMSKLPLFIVRPFNYTGVGQSEKFLIPKIVSHFLRKEPVIELGNLDVWREFGDVRFVSSVYRRLLEKRPVGKTINICTGLSYSLGEVVSLCEEIAGHQIEVKVNPKYVRANEVRVLSGDNSLLKEIIGDFEPFTLEDTLEWMLQAN